MVFTSLTFVVFLCLVFFAYWALHNTRLQNLVLLFASYTFYAWWDLRFLSLILVSSLVNYVVGLGLDSARTTQAARRRFVWVSCLFNIGLLAFFKYCNFFVEAFQDLALLAGLNTSVPTLRIILPVGISFYTFQALGYTLDVYRGDIKASRDPVAFFTFVSFFPQLVAGPIERAGNLLPQFGQRKHFDYDWGVEGCREILWGFFQKMVIADNMALYVNECYGNHEASTGWQLALATVFFALQIYCDFSGYSHIASGAAKLFGIRLMRNFSYPYFSKNLGEFWRRWHISLYTWFRDYLFIPLGGNQGSRGRVFRNILIVFLISGLWHGASYTFVFWGLLNGLALLVCGAVGSKAVRADRTVADMQPLPALKVLAQTVLTFVWICFTWIFFRAETLSEACHIIKRICLGCVLDWGAVPHPTTEDAQGLVGMVVVFLGLEWLQRHKPHPLAFKGLPCAVQWLIYTAAIWVCFYYMPEKASDFIYFQF